MKPDYKPIESFLKGLDYLKVVSQVRTWLTYQVVGWNVQASSLIRKNFTLKRISEEIEKNDLPLIVEDSLGDGYTSFRLLLKLW